jgi:hypothetical protein
MVRARTVRDRTSEVPWVDVLGTTGGRYFV